MKRIISVLAAMVIVAAMVAALAMPAFAKGKPVSASGPNDNDAFVILCQDRGNIVFLTNDRGANFNNCQPAP